jgi:hypothetical protein
MFQIYVAIINCFIDDFGCALCNLIFILKQDNDPLLPNDSHLFS